MRARLASLSLGLLVAACTGPAAEDAAKPAADAASAAPAHAASAPAHAATAGVPPGSGKVLETMDASGYTYVRVDLGGTETWAAGPKVVVKVGDTVTLPAGMRMENYHSSTLDRTFPVVWFVGSIGTGAAAPGVSEEEALAAAHKGVGVPAPAAVEPVARLEGGRTVEEVVTKAAELAGQEIALRGRVVKASFGILGSNWIHVQDGTGAAGTNDLTVTTDAKVAVGDVVVVRGKVVTDKDFGAGYKYAVIVEKAAVEKE